MKRQKNIETKVKRKDIGGNEQAKVTNQSWLSEAEQDMR